jgi:signal transduction histidine kinase
VRLEIQNPGEPVSPELLPRLTEPFFSTKPSGTGLGLAIVRRLTMIHGGELSFTSNRTEGTRAHLVFPRLASSDQRSNSVSETDDSDP